jgi:hypothetical protein
MTLKSLGHDVTLVPGIQSLVEHLAAGRHVEWDLAFNMAQGFHGSARESHAPCPAFFPTYYPSGLSVFPA